MLLSSFVCLFCLMVVLECHTISKNIENYAINDNVIDSIHDTEYTPDYRALRGRTNKKWKKIRDVNIEDNVHGSSNALSTTEKSSFWRKVFKKFKKKQKPLARMRNSISTVSYNSYQFQRKSRNAKNSINGTPRKGRNIEENSARIKRFTSKSINLKPYLSWMNYTTKLKTITPEIKTTKSKFSSKTIDKKTSSTTYKKDEPLYPTSKNSEFTPNYNENDGNISKLLSQMSTKVDELKHMYSLKHIFSNFGTNPTKMSYGDDWPADTLSTSTGGTAQVEALLEEIKVKSLHSMAEEHPAIADLITNTVTETTFAVDPLLNRAVVDKSPLINIVLTTERNKRQSIINSTHDIARRDCNHKAKNYKVLKQLNNFSQRKCAICNLNNCKCKTDNKNRQFEVSMMTTPTTILDDYDSGMLTTSERILAKKHENNFKSLLNSSKSPYLYTWKYDTRFFNRNPETLTNINLKQNIAKLYNDAYGEEMPDDAENIEIAREITHNITTKNLPVEKDTMTTYKMLEDKFAFNDYVNGYKSYLNFQRELGQDKFSNLVRYQAHRHHNVDDIGKYIRNKIPRIPDRRKRKFNDESDPMEDQDVSTKSDESWFKKHFYFFIDNSPPKKYHTSENMSVKLPGPQSKLNSVNKVALNKKQRMKMATTNNIHLGEYNDNKIAGENKNFSVLEIHANDADFLEIVTKKQEDNNLNLKETPRFEYYEEDNPSQASVNIRSAKHTTDIDIEALENQISKELKLLDNNQSGMRTRRSMNYDQKEHSDGKFAITNDIFDIESLNLEENPKKRQNVNKKTSQGVIQKFLSKFSFRTHNKKKNKKLKRQTTLIRVPRYNNPLKKFKNLFRNTAKMSESSDDNIFNTRITTFRPIKYDQTMNIEDIKQALSSMPDEFSYSVDEFDLYKTKSSDYFNNIENRNEEREATILTTTSGLDTDTERKINAFPANTLKDANSKLFTYNELKKISSSEPLPNILDTTNDDIEFTTTMDKIRNEIDKVEERIDLIGKSNMMSTTNSEKQFDTINVDNNSPGKVDKKIQQQPLDEVTLTLFKSYLKSNNITTLTNVEQVTPNILNIIKMSDKTIVKKTNNVNDYLEDAQSSDSIWDISTAMNKQMLWGDITTEKKFPHDYLNDLEIWNNDVLNLDDPDTLNQAWMKGMKITKPSPTADSIIKLRQELEELNKRLFKAENVEKEESYGNPKISLNNKTDLLQQANMLELPITNFLVYSKLYTKTLPEIKPGELKDKIILNIKEHVSEINEGDYNFNNVPEGPALDQVMSSELSYNNDVGLSSRISSFMTEIPHHHIMNYPTVPITKVSTRPQQYYTTPLPMPMTDFNKFLKEHDIDVNTVTAPIMSVEMMEQDKVNNENRLLKTNLFNKDIEPKTIKSEVKNKFEDFYEDFVNNFDDDTGITNNLVTKPVSSETRKHKDVNWNNNLSLFKSISNKNRKFENKKSDSKLPGLDITIIDLNDLKLNSYIPPKLEYASNDRNNVSVEVEEKTTTIKEHKTKVIKKLTETKKTTKPEKKTTKVSKKIHNDTKKATKVLKKTTKKPDKSTKSNLQKVKPYTYKKAKQVNECTTEAMHKMTDELKKATEKIEKMTATCQKSDAKFIDEITRNNGKTLDEISEDFYNKIASQSEGPDEQVDVVNSTSTSPTLLAKLQDKPKRIFITSTMSKYDIYYDNLKRGSKMNKPRTTSRTLNLRSVDSIPDYNDDNPERNRIIRSYGMRRRRGTQTESPTTNIFDISRASFVYDLKELGKKAHRFGRKHKFLPLFEIRNNPKYKFQNLETESTEANLASKTTIIKVNIIPNQSIMVSKLNANDSNTTDGSSVTTNKKPSKTTPKTISRRTTTQRTRKYSGAVKPKVTYQMKGFYKEMTVQKRNHLHNLFTKKCRPIAHKSKASKMKNKISTEQIPKITSDMVTASIEEPLKIKEDEYDSEYREMLSEGTKLTRSTTENETDDDSDDDDEEVYYEPTHKRKKSEQTKSTDTDTKVEKRDVHKENTFTAKNVAAFEVVVDMTRHSDNGVASYVQDSISKSDNLPITKSNDEAVTNAIQVHIVVPYSSQNDVKRELPFRVRRVFTAKLSSPIDLEYQIQSIESFPEKTTQSYVSSTIGQKTTTVVYLIVGVPEEMRDPEYSKSTSNKILTQNNPSINSKVSTIKNVGKVTLSRDFISALNKQLKLYTASDLKKDIKRSVIKKINIEHELQKRNINWSLVESYFGHDKSLKCHCKPNKPMCKACAACNTVVSEITFELDNLAKYMNDHCSEIQRFFYLNPGGGKKLRTTAKKIDRSLQDCYKKIKKDSPHACKLNIMTMDKRDILTNVSDNNPDSILEKLRHLANDLEIARNYNLPFDISIRDKGKNLVNTIENCVSGVVPNSIQKFGNKTIYALDNISVNIFCNPQTTLYPSLTNTMPVLDLNKDVYGYTSHYDYNRKNSGSLRNLLLYDKRKKKIKTVDMLKTVTHTKREAINNQIETPIANASKITNDNESRSMRNVKKGKLLKNIRNKISTKATITDITTELSDSYGLSDLTNIPEYEPYTDDISELLKNISLEITEDTTYSVNFETNSTKKRPQQATTKAYHKTTPLSTSRLSTVPHSAKSVSKTLPKTSSIHTTRLSTNTKATTKLTRTNTRTKASSLVTTKTKNKTDRYFLNKIKSVTGSLLNKLEKKTHNIKIMRPSKKQTKVNSRTQLTGTKITTPSTKKNKYKLQQSISEVNNEPDSDYGSLLSTLLKYEANISEYHRQKRRKNSHRTHKEDAVLIPKPHTTSKSKTKLTKMHSSQTHSAIFSSESTDTKVSTATNPHKPQDRHKHLTSSDAEQTKSTIDTTAESIFNYYKSLLKQERSTTEKAEKHLKSKSFISKLLSSFDIEMKPDVKKKVDKESHLRGLREAMDDKISNKIHEKTRNDKAVNLEPEPNKQEISTTNYLHIMEENYRKETKTPQPDYLCDLHATFEHVRALSRVLRKNEFENYVRDIKCHKRKPTPEYFFIEPCTSPSVKQNVFKKFKKSVPKWNWIRDKRSEHMDKEPSEYYTEDDLENDEDKEWDKTRVLIKSAHKVSGEDFDEDDTAEYKIRSDDDLVNFVIRDEVNFDKFYRRNDGVYRRNKRTQRNADFSELTNGLRNLPPLTPPKDEIYAMRGDFIVLHCYPPGSKAFKGLLDITRYDWKTDRDEMLEYDNVAVEGHNVYIRMVQGKNVGNYSCSKDKVLQRSVHLTVTSLPKYNTLFSTTYETDSGCNYEDLKSLQCLGHVMAEEACSCDRHCSIRVDEPTCVRDKEDGRLRTRAIIVMVTARQPRVYCSVQCRRDLQSSLALLTATNAPSLATVKVILLTENGNKTLVPSHKDPSSYIVTRTLRSKDSNHHREYRHLSSHMRPGDVDVVVSCPAGFYLVREHKICVSCPSDAVSSAGENACTRCPRGTRAPPGSARCRVALVARPRRYEWRWCPPCACCALGWGALAVGACAAVALSGAVRAAVRRRSSVAAADSVCVPDKTVPSSGRKNVPTARKCSSTLTYSARITRGRHMSPSRVILTRFFKGTPPSSRATDSQETKLETWKEKEIPPPLPPIDFDT